jgi:ABC-type uncharacterized transport system substrate-binding protein
MNKIFGATWIITVLLSVLAMSSAIAADFRIGYFEIDHNERYDTVFQALLKAIKDRGWENKLKFPPEVHISVTSTATVEEQNRKAKELLVRTDINAIIVMGTFGTGAILNNYDGRLPIFSEVVTDAVKEGFVPNENDSGKDNFTVSIAPSRYKNMFRIFHEEVFFRSLGVMHSETRNRNKESNLDDAEMIAQERDFIIVSYNLSEHELKDNAAGCLEGLKELVKKGMDAFFIPSLNCFKMEKSGSNVKQLMDFLLDKKIPTFARRGTDYVKSGAMMGFSEDFDTQGKSLANKLFAVLVKTEKPRSLSMIDDSPPKLVLNLAVAQRIGFRLSFDILGASDEIYQEIFEDVGGVK